jgi:hypothetical protein
MLFAEDETKIFGIGWGARKQPTAAAVVAGATADEEMQAKDLMASANVGQRSLHRQLVQVRAEPGPKRLEEYWRFLIQVES